MTDADHTVVTKQCTKCGETKPASSFNRLARSSDGLHAQCRACTRAYKRQQWAGAGDEQAEMRRAKRRAWYEANKEYVKECNARYWEENRASIGQQQRQRREVDLVADRHREACREYYQANKESILAYHREYRRSNRERINKMKGAYHHARQKDDPAYAMRKRIAANISGRIRVMGYTKQSKTQEILGCDWLCFKAHIERQFLKGMTWDNRSEWHIDHIVPISSAKTEEDVIRLNHFTNLRPMWAKDNIAKGNRITHLI